jgi:hypothetical protein
MRYPTIHGFLKWAPAAIGSAAFAAAAIWTEVKDWIAVQAVWGWHQMSDPWIATVVILCLCAYIWAIIWTGQAPKAKPVKTQPGVLLIGQGLDHVRVETNPEVRSPHEARFFPTAPKAAGVRSKTGSRDSTANLRDCVEDRTRGSFLRYLFQAKHRDNMDRAMDRAVDLSGLGTVGDRRPAETWIPLDQAIRHLARRSQWSEHQDARDPNFSIDVSRQIHDAFACGDLVARGRYFHVLKGGVAAAHPLTPIPKKYWKRGRIEAYWPLAGAAQNIASHRVENVVRNGDHEGMHDVRLEQAQVEALWPPRQTPFEAPQIPFARIRDLAAEYDLNLDHRDPASHNLAYDIEGELKNAAANNRLQVWGRPYQGEVRDNDPLIPIPASHFHKYSFRHGSLAHPVKNRHTFTTTIDSIAQGKEEQAGVTFYDLHASTMAARAILQRIADERGLS